MFEAVQQWPDLAQVVNRHQCKRSAGFVLGLEGEGFQKIAVASSGWLAISKSLPDGNKLIMDFVLPGEIFEGGSADPSLNAFQLEAITDVAIALIPKDAWNSLIEGNPDLGEVYQQYWLMARARMSERMLRIGKGTAETRVAFALIELCLRMRGSGGEDDNCRQFHVPLTQQQLGEFVGLSSVHVCRTLRRLRRNGIVQVSDHMNIEIMKLDGLADIAGVDVGQVAREIVG